MKIWVYVKPNGIPWWTPKWLGFMDVHPPSQTGMV